MGSLFFFQEMPMACVWSPRDLCDRLLDVRPKLYITHDVFYLSSYHVFGGSPSIVESLLLLLFFRIFKFQLTYFMASWTLQSIPSYLNHTSCNPWPPIIFGSTESSFCTNNYYVLTHNPLLTHPGIWVMRDLIVAHSLNASTILFNRFKFGICSSKISCQAINCLSLGLSLGILLL